MSIAYLTARAVVLEAEYIEDLLDGPVEPGRDDVDHDHFLTGRDYGRAVRDCIDAWRAEGLDYTRASYCAIALIDLARTRHPDCLVDQKWAAATVELTLKTLHESGGKAVQTR